MSANPLYLWDARQHHSVPTNFSEAITEFQSLSKKTNDRITDSMLTFAQRLQDLVCIMQYRDNASMVALYSNLVADMRQHQGALYPLDLPEDANDRLLAQYVITDTAAQCGLIVFDDNLGLVFLPTRKIFPVNKGESWLNAVSYMLKQKSDSDVIRTEAQLKKLAYPKLKQLSEKYGYQETKIPFLKDELGFVRTFQDLTQYLQIQYIKECERLYIYISAYLYIPEVSLIYKKFDFGLLGGRLEQYSYKFSPQLLIDEDRLSKKNQWCIGNKNELESVLNRIEDYYFNDLLEKSSTIKDIDSIVNVLGLAKDHFNPLHMIVTFFPQLLIIARLAGNPHFEQLVCEFEEVDFWGANQNAKATELPKLLDYLRNEVKPII